MLKAPFPFSTKPIKAARGKVTNYINKGKKVMHRFRNIP